MPGEASALAPSAWSLLPARAAVGELFIAFLVVLALGFAGYGVRERKSRMRRRHYNLG